MSEANRGARVVRSSTAGQRQLRAGRGSVVAVAGPPQGSRLDIHINELRQDAGQGPYHLHTNAENFFLVLEGRVALRLGGEDHIVVPGDAAFVPPNVPHSVSPLDGRAARVLEIYAPADPDFIHVEEEESQ